MNLVMLHRPSIGVMSALTPMVAHQHPGASGPHPHGWVQFQPTSFLHPHQASGLPVPISSSPVRFDTQRNMPRFVPLGQLYEPNPTFSYYADSSSRTHPWSRDNGPHFLLPWRVIINVCIKYTAFLSQAHQTLVKIITFGGFCLRYNVHIM